MNDEQRKRLFQLFAVRSDETITVAEHQELLQALRTDAEARRLWFVHQDVEVGLRTQLKAPSVVVPLSRRWLQWRPLTAAAAGLVIGLFSASMVFAYGLPKVVRQVLALANAGFEGSVAPMPDGLPVRFGVWSGDYAEVVGAQQGIVPRKGKHMFRFLRSDSREPSSSGGTIFNGNMYQLIDVRTWREAVASGMAVVDWSAWFNCAPEASGTKSKFEASVWAFAGDTSFVRKNWEEKLHQELAYSSWKIIADDDLKSWQPIAGSMILPPDTDFLVIELKAVPGMPSPVNGAVTFSGHYADDVQLVLRTNARQPPVALSRTKP